MPQKSFTTCVVTKHLLTYLQYNTCMLAHGQTLHGKPASSRATAKDIFKVTNGRFISSLYYIHADG